jgi:hypothetical protein
MRSPTGINISLQAYGNQKKNFCQFGDGEIKYVRSIFWVSGGKNVISGNGHPLG